MAFLRFAAYIVFGLIPVTLLGAVAVLTLVGSMEPGVMGAVIGPMLPIAVFGFLGALAFWATMFAAPNDAIRLGLLCGIGATILLLGFLVFVVGRHLFGEPWLLGIGACAVSSAIVAATYLAKGGRPRLRSSGEEVDDQQGR